MRKRSVSVKRTVVDLSFSFFMSLNFRNRIIGLSLPTSNQGAGRQLKDISEVSPCEELSVRIAHNREWMYKIRYIRQASLPHRAAACTPDEAGAVQSRFNDLLCLLIRNEWPFRVIHKTFKTTKLMWTVSRRSPSLHRKIIETLFGVQLEHCF